MSYFDIAGIGSNPYMMSPLGAYGLPAGGTYSSYGMSPMMGMTTGIGMAGYPGIAGYSGMGMMGMYNPMFMGQMNQAMHDLEKSNLDHAGAMHRLQAQNGVEAFKVHDEVLFQKSMVDSGVQGAVTNLASVIKSGDADAICQEYDKLVSELYTKYSDYLNKNSENINPKVAIRKHIEDLYSAIMSKKTGEIVSLQNDIKRYGETAFMHGFNRDFLGNKGYHDNYTEETLSYLYGTRIDSKGRKDKMEKIGGYAGRTVEGAVAYGAGYGGTLALTGLLSMLSSNVRNFLTKGVAKDAAGKILKDEAGKALVEHTFSNGLKKAGKYCKWAAIAALAGDVLWQCTRD